MPRRDYVHPPWPGTRWRANAVRVACLCWGSLYWDKGELPVEEWRSGGPVLPLEFARLSSKGKPRERLTLVIVEGGTEVQTLWGEIAGSTILDAVEHLREREGIPVKNGDRDIGRWPHDLPTPFPFEDAIAAWVAATDGVDGAVWTALPANVGNSPGRLPSLDELRAYVAGRTAATLPPVREYIEKAPEQTATRYRDALTQAVSSHPSALRE